MYGLAALELDLVSTVVLETACVLGNATLKEVATKKRLLIQVGVTDLSALSWSVAGVVTERGAADGDTHALAHGVGTAHPFGLGASTVGLLSAVVSKMASDWGKITIQEEVAVDRTLIEVESRF